MLDDFEDTVELLKHVAGSMKTCDNPRLQSLGYHRINFQKHRYFMLYRIEDDVVYVDDIFHELQDDEKIIYRKIVDGLFYPLTMKEIRW